MGRNINDGVRIAAEERPSQPYAPKRLATPTMDGHPRERRAAAFGGVATNRGLRCPANHAGTPRADDSVSARGSSGGHRQTEHVDFAAESSQRQDVHFISMMRSTVSGRSHVSPNSITRPREWGSSSTAESR